ncbi:hypothetical protein HYS10_00755 [Candidatus Collierbacteria bacterium]|nr:hypothetical protein [Candidatus Collierbacteria bacterium]
MTELPTTLKEIAAIKEKTLRAADGEVIFYENGIAMIVGKRGGREVTPDSTLVAKMLSALKAGGHRINHYQYIPYYAGSDVECVLVDYGFREPREEDV